MQDRQQERCQGIGIGRRGQIAFGLCPLEPLTQSGLSGCTQLDQHLPHRFRVIRSRQHAVDEQATGMVWMPRVQISRTVQDMRSHLARGRKRQRLGTHAIFPGVADYAGSKAALIGYAKGVARDLGPRNITVNVVQPGIMPTNMAAAVVGDASSQGPLMDLHPVRRIATLDEVAETVCFLAGPAAGYITGEVLSVSGGAGI